MQQEGRKRRLAKPTFVCEKCDNTGYLHVLLQSSLNITVS